MIVFQVRSVAKSGPEFSWLLVKKLAIAGMEAGKAEKALPAQKIDIAQSALSYSCASILAI